MKRIFSALIAVTLLIIINPLHSRAKILSGENKIAARSKTNINREWQFHLGDLSERQKENRASVKWEQINLPHSFSLPYFLSPEFYTGYGWYEKTVVINKEDPARQFFLEFEGVFQVAEIYVNNVLAGSHRGGYNGFSVDITGLIKKGENVIAVRVNNIWDAKLAPRAGEHVFSGGIYRDVWLVETNPVHVDWYGTFITTPELTTSSGKVNARTEVRNNAKMPKEGMLTTTVFDPAGKQILTMDTSFSVKPGEVTIVDQTSASINNPALWSPASPRLYKAVTRIRVDGSLSDEYETSFGMRWVRWTADSGFFLNGQRHYFRGANVHQDRAGWGDAVTNEGFARDIRMMKEAGFDFIRGAHYPHDPAFSEACDKEGVLFWSENCFWGIGGFKQEGDWSSSAYPTRQEDEAAFEASVKESLAEMIRIHRNHPSIIVWSMSNEPFFSAPEQMPKVRRLLKDLVTLTHQLDPSRAAAIGGCQRGEIDKLGDVAGYNGDGARLYINPGIPSVVSEYGSTIADRPGEYKAGLGDLQEETFTWRSGQAIWCGFDHGSIAGHFGSMGIVDYFRLPKRQWYWYRNAYRHIPAEVSSGEGIPYAIRLTTDKTGIDHADGTDDVHLTATIVDKAGIPISNSPDVRLEILSGPGEFPTGSSVHFSEKSDIAIRDGKAAIELRAYYAGKTVIEATSPGLKPGRITIRSSNAPAHRPRHHKKISRPYVRYMQAEKDEDNMEINLLAERPAKVSSFEAPYSSRFANDLDTTSSWKPGIAAAGNAWWQVDMENIYDLSRVRLVFSEPVQARYTIEVSLNGIDWVPIIEQATGGGLVHEETVSGAQACRFLRVRFQGGAQDAVHITDIRAFGRKAS